jgi:hypothetical protein
MRSVRWHPTGFLPSLANHHSTQPPCRFIMPRPCERIGVCTLRVACHMQSCLTSPSLALVQRIALSLSLAAMASIASTHLAAQAPESRPRVRVTAWELPQIDTTRLVRLSTLGELLSAGPPRQPCLRFENLCLASSPGRDFIPAEPYREPGLAYEVDGHTYCPDPLLLGLAAPPTQPLLVRRVLAIAVFRDSTALQKLPCRPVVTRLIRITTAAGQ